MTFKPHDLDRLVDEFVTENKDWLEKERWKVLSTAIAQAKNQTDLKWAGALDVKKAMEASFLKILGPKDDRDLPVKKVMSFRCP